MIRFYQISVIITSIIAKLFVLTFGLSGIVSIIAFTGLSFFQNIDNFISLHTAKLAHFIPIEEGLSPFRSWSNLGNTLLSIFPYMIISLFFENYKEKAKSKGIPDFYVKILARPVKEWIPFGAKLIISVQILLSIFGTFNNYELSGLFQYINLFLMGVILSHEFLPEEFKMSTEITSKDIYAKKIFEMKQDLNKALNLYNAKNYLASEIECRNYIKKYGSSKDIILILSIVLAEQGKIIEAYQSIQECEKNFPDDNEVLKVSELIKKTANVKKRIK